MSIDKLEQYRFLKLEKQDLAENIDYYESLLDRLYKRLKRCNNDIEEIENFIVSEDDEIIKQIIKMRFLDNRKWIDVSMALGSSNESYARNLFNRYLKKSNERQQWIIWKVFKK